MHATTRDAAVCGRRAAIRRCGPRRRLLHGVSVESHHRRVEGHRQGGSPGTRQWLAGYESTGRGDAVAGCHRRSFTGGPVRMTQYLAADGFDADVLCTSARPRKLGLTTAMNGRGSGNP